MCPHDSWYEQDCEPDYNCPECDKKQDKLDQCAEYVKEIVVMLYSKNDLDLAKFESYWDCLCDELKVEVNLGELMIRRHINEYAMS